MKRILFSVLVLFLCTLGLALFWAQRQLTGSLPDLDGEVVLDGLASLVTVDRDAKGVPTIRGENRVDLARALGFVHGQERFFQMDLMRRRAAGELSELLGPSMLDVDRYHRVHRMRARAERVLERASVDEMALVSAYVEGVNAGLGALEAPPFEYVALRSDPTPWRAPDCVLVVFSMFFELNDDHGTLESADALLRDVLSPELAAFLSPAGTEWDAPLFGDAILPPPIPGPGAVELEAPSTARVGEVMEIQRADIGSNNWALASTKTRHGGAILASDMHLGHAVPNLWYRALLIYGSRRLAGVTLPGTPSLVAGSNGDIAWGFTNTEADWVDLVEAEPPFSTFSETIAVRGEAPVAFEVRETDAGPVIDEDHRGRARAVRWIAHHPRGVNLRLALLEETETVSAALAIAPTLGIPPQNFVVAGRGGSIGWTVAGRIPKRTEDNRWDGFFEGSEYTVLENPPSGAIWTANARVADGEMLRRMGDGGYSLGARAKQIRDALLPLTSATEKDMLAIQLDDRALFLERWRILFLDLLREKGGLEDVERVLNEGWTGRASIDSAGYRAARELRRAVIEEVLGTLAAKVLRADPRFGVIQLRQPEGPAWQLVSERPAHLVAPPYRSWEDWLFAILEKTTASWPRPLQDRTWGQANTSKITHPLSDAFPRFLSRFLDAPPRPLPGHTDMPRVQGTSHGASERLVVSPGREDEALFHMPGGQSGHPLSPYYLAGHEDWEEGRATPLLPEATVFSLRLIPRGTSSPASTSR